MAQKSSAIEKNAMTTSYCKVAGGVTLTLLQYN